MHLLSLLALLLVSPKLVDATQVAFKSDTAPATARKAFKDAGIVPDVIPAFDPVLEVDITYQYDTNVKRAVLGTQFAKYETQNFPLWALFGVPPKLRGANFVAVIIDPDAPKPEDPKNAQFRHFLGADFTLWRGALLHNSSAALSEYVQPSPPSESKPHRYVFLVYRQSEDIPKTISSGNAKFNVTAFAEKYNLGPPLGGNFLTVSTQDD
ncbi:PEBP-like protein [Sistotremastrum niveocremeum HHB9708]|uniref:PEBP-like protein n=2 Tax=Sistotremastraceae TaxID=3402574 RepID=A0A164QTA5_9AGAM|nr:PEBP-like protein [Sistotremastrum niveocremeum HHB9708]KZT35490.1 PEBP-like protein [Sistotremastrum suecicum HHB10207 ss-3]